MNRLLLLVALAVPVLTHAADAKPATWPAFLPWIAGGVEEKGLSNGKTTVLVYSEPDASAAKKFRAALEKDGFKLEPDDIPGMTGSRFLARKGNSSAYFTIKPNAGSKTKTQVIVTDTSGAP